MGNLDRSLRHGPFDALSDRLGPSDANLFGRKADELGEKCAFILDRGRKKLSDGELERGETDLALFRDNGGEVTFSARIEQLFFETEARRDDPDDLARHDPTRSEEHTSELQSRPHLVCRLLLEKKKKNTSREGNTHELLTMTTRLG